MPLLDAFKIDRFKVDGGGGLKIKSIQRGTITISSGLTATATVNAVDLSKAVLFHNGATSESAGGCNSPIIELTDATTITATRSYSTATGAVNYTLVEFEGLEKITMGTFEFTNSPSTLTIDEVDLGKTILLVNGKTGGGNDAAAAYYRLELTDATTITGYKGQSTATFTVGYILLTFK